MKFITIASWEPHQRDELFKKRMENGRMAPKGIKVIGEWLDIQGGRAVWLHEADSAMEGLKWSNRWNDINKFESFPVVEVKDDKGTQLSE